MDNAIIPSISCLNSNYLLFDFSHIEIKFKMAKKVEKIVNTGNHKRKNKDIHII